MEMSDLWLKKLTMIKNFLYKKGLTEEYMDAAWTYMYDKHSAVRYLTDHNDTWKDLSIEAMETFLEKYNEQNFPENFNLLEWYDSILIARKLRGN